MDPKDIKTRLKALRALIGNKCHVNIHVTSSSYSSDKPVSWSLYPNDISHDPRFSGDEFTFEDALDAAEVAWEAYAIKHEAEILREMALDIIRITADMGACSDAALRAGKFSAAEVTKYGERACIEANEIAGKGPFSIVAISAISNAA